MTLDGRRSGLIFADDSGGQADRLRSLAALSGPARVLLALERDLRKALRLFGAREMKWAGLRTKAARLEAAEACLDLLGVGLAAGALRLDVLLWRPADQPKAAQARTEAQRLRPLYAEAWSRAAAAWKLPLWRAFPDQRTGMDWQRWSPTQRRAWRRAGIRRLLVREARSHQSACVQLTDLVAGLCRLERREDEGPAGARAHAARLGLQRRWLEAWARRGLAVGRRGELPYADRRHLQIRLLRRLPTRS